MDRKDADAIVIGAGVAGLAAAARLAGGGLATIVLEARDRPGGRVLPARTSAGVPIELGAEFIHGPAPETRALLQRAGSSWIPRTGSSWRFERGTLRPDDAAPFDEAMLASIAGLERDETVDAYVNRRIRDDPGSAPQLQRLREFAEGFDAADPAIAGLLAIVREWTSGTDAVTARPVDGYQPLLDRLLADAESVGVDLRYGDPVSHLDWSEPRVAIELANSDVRLRARCAILTVPIGVLQAGDLTVAPDLPPGIRAALARLRMGHVFRLVMTFATPFWETAGDGRYRDACAFTVVGGPVAAYWTQLPQRRNQIVAWTGGPRAEQLLRRPHRERVEIALDGLRRLFGPNAVDAAPLLETADRDWSADPFARGAYSYVLAGDAPADVHAELARPFDARLFLAGEATASGGQSGTVNGALRSGMRAADAALASLAHVPSQVPT